MEIQNLMKDIERKQKEVNAKKERERIEDARNLKKLQEEKKEDNKKSGEKEILLDKILKWAKDFSSSKEYKNALKLLEDDEIEIFGSGWGHFLDYSYSDSDIGCWSWVNLNKNGILEYKSGYKWMGFRVCFLINRKNLSKIKYKYLEELNKAIETGKVYERIKKEIKESC